MKARGLLMAAAALAAALAACRTAGAPPPPPPPAPSSPSPPPATASPAPPAPPASPGAPAPARKLAIMAWAEPARLREGGGQAQIIVRVRRPSGAPAPNVEVRVSASRGSLYSAGRPLRTSASGMTRDRLTTRETAVVVVEAEGNRVELTVPVGEGG